MPENHSFRWYAMGPFTVFDTETTGQGPQYNALVEIAALRVECDGTERRFHTLLNPGRPIPPMVQRIHGISDSMVADAPFFHQIAEDFLAFVAGSTLVAHNAMFDLGFLQHSLARSGLPPYNGKVIDSLKLARTAFPQLKSHKLQTLRMTLHLGCGDETAHRAMGDVEITRDLFALILETLSRGEHA